MINNRVNSEHYVFCPNKIKTFLKCTSVKSANYYFYSIKEIILKKKNPEAEVQYYYSLHI